MKPAVHGPLSDAQVAQFHRDGFLVVPGLFSPDEMKQITAWVDEAQAWPEQKGHAWMYFETTDDGRRLLNRMERVLTFHDGLRSVAADDRMQGATGQLFGEPAVLFKDKINFKLPGGGGFEAHQDAQAGWERYGGLHITALITVDRTTRENGCLEMAAGYHDRGLIGSEWEPLNDDNIGDMQFVPIEAEPGDAVFFDSYAPHRSAPNRTDQPRRVLYITYGRASDGDQLERYYADKFVSYPPDIEREAGKEYRYKV
ncbi:MAG TPA: phytanoyl-CoA dioxygenase family protein [Chromatiales bacterium]|nr:phytanoyl-CoA dioxygenase family protein [Chromatiales bacterium]